MTTTSAALQTGIRTRRMQAVVGQPAFADWLNKIKDGVNSAPQQSQEERVQVNAFNALGTYTFMLDGMLYSYTEDGTGANVNDVATQITNDWNSGGFPPGRGVAEASDQANEVVLTGTWPGVEFEVNTDMDPDLSNFTNVAPEEADDVGFGFALVGLGYAAGGVYATGDTLEQIAVARTDAFGPSNLYFDDFIGLAAGRLEIVIDASIHDLGVITASAPWNATIPQTLADLKTALDAALFTSGLDQYMNCTVGAGPDSFSVDTNGGMEGFAFDAMIAHDLGIAAINKIVNVFRGTSIVWSWAGVSIARYDVTSQDFGSTDEPSYAPNAGVPFLKRGFVWVERPETPPIQGGRVFVEMDPGSDFGTFHTNQNGTRLPLPFDVAKWERDGRIATDGLSLLNLGNF